MTSPLPDPNSWFVGLVSAPMLKANLTDPANAQFNAKLPQHYLTNTAGTSIPSGTDTTVSAWSTVSSARMGGLSSGTRTITVAGFYAIDATITFPPAVTGFIRSRIMVNGNVVDAYGANTTGSTHNTVAEVNILMALAVGDTVAITAFQNSGSAQALSTDPGSNHWSMAWLGNV